MPPHPTGVQHVGRAVDGVNDGLQRLVCAGLVLVVLRIEAFGQAEQVGALSSAEVQHFSNARQQLAGSGHAPALLQPRQPGRADFAQLRQFFTPQAGRAAAADGWQADTLRRSTFAVGANEFA
jgi:hypothetical protein